MNKISEFFIKNVTVICAKHDVSLNFSIYDSEFEIYEAMVEKGIDQDDIISYFSSSISLEFVDVSEKEFYKDAVMPDKIEDLINHVKVFPYIEDDVLKVAISTPEQKEYAENVICESNYIFTFSFQFLIDMNLKSINSNDVFFEKGLDYAEKSLFAINNERKRILLATGQDELDALFESSEYFIGEYCMVGKIQTRSLLKERCDIENPDILIVGDNIGGKTPLTEILLGIRIKYPDMRIIYLAGDLDPKDISKKNMFGSLAAVKIYDIITKTELSVLTLKDILDNPMGESDVKEFLNSIKDSDSKKKNNINIHVPEYVETDESVNICPNLYTFTSPKGGTGKTFILKHIAIAIATCGVQRTTGSKPRIGIIDLDFQGFGISKFFNTLNDKDNIFSAVEEVKKVIDDLGKVKNIDKEVSKYVNERIHQSFKTSSKYSNIKVLGGTDKFYHRGDNNILDNYQLTYIVETVSDDFDVILIDANTSMDTNAIYPLYSISNTTYFVLNMDWETFHNNQRYMMYLENESFFVPSQSKFILNRASASNDLFVSLKDIETGLGITFSSIIPNIDTVTIFNLSCKSDNLIESKNDDFSEIKYYFLRLANDLYPIVNFDILSSNMENKSIFKISKKPLKLNKRDKSNDVKKDKKDFIKTLKNMFGDFKVNKKTEDVDMNEDDINS